MKKLRTVTQKPTNPFAGTAMMLVENGLSSVRNKLAMIGNRYTMIGDIEA
jgi:hypothetical protein